MKKIIIFIILALTLLPVFAFEWGGIVDNYSKVKTSEFKKADYDQTDNAFLWITSPLGNNFKFSAEAYYRFNLYAAEKKTTLKNIVDLDLFKFTGNFKIGGGKISANAGRFFVADKAGAVFSQCSDGLSVDFTMPVLGLNFYAGYTGLLNSLTVSMLNKDGTPYSKKGEIYVLNYKYLPVSLGASLPYLLGNNIFNVQFLSFIDFEKVDYSKFYGEFTANGPITDGIYYSFKTVFGTRCFNNLMNYSSAGITFYPVDILTVDGGIEYASGKHLCFNSYTSITSKTAYDSALSPQLSGVILPQISLTLAESIWYARIAGKVVLSAPEKTVKFEGVDTDLNVIVNVLSDVQVGLDIGAYFDSKSSKNNNFTAGLKVSVSF